MASHVALLAAGPDDAVIHAVGPAVDVRAVDGGSYLFAVVRMDESQEALAARRYGARLDTEDAVCLVRPFRGAALEIDLPVAQR